MKLPVSRDERPSLPSFLLRWVCRPVGVTVTRVYIRCMLSEIDKQPTDVAASDMVPERERFDFERERALHELRQKELELQIRREELKRHGSTPLLVAILAGVVALTSNAIVAVIQGRGDRDLERKKFEAQLISKAVDVNDHDLAARNLSFLLKAGLERMRAAESPRW